MKKANISIVIIAIILLIIICSIGYILLSLRLNNVEKRGYIESCQEYLNSETDFLQTYGKIISFQTNDTYPPTKVELQNGKEYYMDFQCETEKAVFEIRVFHIFTDEWSYRYDVNKETIIWK